MNTLPAFPNHKLTMGFFRLNILNGRARFIPEADLDLSTSQTCGSVSRHTLKAPGWPHPVHIMLEKADIPSNRITYHSGFQSTATLKLPQAMPLPSILTVLNIGQLRYHTHLLMFSHGVHAGLFSPQMRQHLQLLPESNSAEALLDMLEILREQGAVALLDFNPACAARTVAFADTAQLRANPLAMQAIQPLLRSML